MLNKSTSALQAYILVGIGLGLYFVMEFQKVGYAPDDTFIYLKYAKNIASGNGFSFNAGEPSYGITSPLWSLLLTIPYLIGSEPFMFAKYFDLVLAMLSVLVFYRVSGYVITEKPPYPPFPDTAGGVKGGQESGNSSSSRIYDRISGASLTHLQQAGATLIFMMNTWFARWTFTGMETSLAVLLVLLVIGSFYRNKFYVMPVVLGLLFMVRPESFVLAAICFLLAMKQDEKPPKVLLYIIVYLLVIAPWLIYAKMTFGSFVSNTALGKATFTFNIDVIIGQLKRIFGTLALSSVMEMILSLSTIFLAWRAKELHRYALLILWPLGLIVLYVVTDADIISRYLLIITPMILLLGFRVFGYMGKKLRIMNYELRVEEPERQSPPLRSSPFGKREFVTWGLAALSLIVIIQSQWVFYKMVKPHTDGFTMGVNNCFKEIGFWLRDNTQKDSKVIANDVGAVGYYSERYIIDAAALVNRDLSLNKKIMQMPVSERENAENILTLTDADYVIAREDFAEDRLKNVIVSGKKFQLMMMREFAGLGMSEEGGVKWYKVYKVIK